MFGYFSTFRRVRLPCPYCNNRRLIDCSSGIIVYADAEEDFQRGYEPHFYVKCRKCKNEIGIMIKGFHR